MVFLHIAQTGDSLSQLGYWDMNDDGEEREKIFKKSRQKFRSTDNLKSLTAWALLSHDKKIYIQYHIFLLVCNCISANQEKEISFLYLVVFFLITYHLKTVFSTIFLGKFL